MRSFLKHLMMVTFTLTLLSACASSGSRGSSSTTSISAPLFSDSGSAVDDNEVLSTPSREATQPVPLTGQCGVERWDVKTGTDALAGSVVLAPKVTTIKDLASRPRQIGPGGSRSSAEEQTYTVTAILTGHKAEGDSDIHLILTDGTDQMIAEIPDPACVGKSSPFAAQITQARRDFQATVARPLSDSFVTSNVKVTITGVLFFDFQHNQTGAAPNEAELHPVLSIKFG